VANSDPRARPNAAGLPVRLLARMDILRGLACLAKKANRKAATTAFGMVTATGAVPKMVLARKREPKAEA
jgi:hypothetical protein